MTTPPPDQPFAPPPPPRRKKWPLILAVTLGALLLLCGGLVAIVAAVGNNTAEVLDPGPTPATAQATTAPTKATPTKAAPAEKSAVTFADGSWVVGSNGVSPGVYQVTVEVTGMCIWRITRAGSNGEGFIAGDITQGGRPQVTLKAGQEFNSTGCGTWRKTG